MKLDNKYAVNCWSSLAVMRKNKARSRQGVLEEEIRIKKEEGARSRCYLLDVFYAIVDGHGWTRMSTKHSVVQADTVVPLTGFERMMLVKIGRFEWLATWWFLRGIICVGRSNKIIHSSWPASDLVASGCRNLLVLLIHEYSEDELSRNGGWLLFYLSPTRRRTSRELELALWLLSGTGEVEEFWRLTHLCRLQELLTTETQLWTWGGNALLFLTEASSFEQS